MDWLILLYNRTMEKIPLLRRVSAIVSWVFIVLLAVDIVFLYGRSFSAVFNEIESVLYQASLLFSPVVLILSIIDVFKKPRQRIVIVALLVVIFFFFWIYRASIL